MSLHYQKKVQLEEITLSYCPRCFEYEAEHPPQTVFHGLQSSFLPRHPGGILKPALDREFLERECKNYLRYLQRERLHLGPLDIAGLSTDDCDLQFAFGLETLKKTYPKIEFMDHRLWSILGFCDVEEKDREDFESRLFLPDYSYNPEDPVEVLLDELDLSLAAYVLTYSPPASEAASQLKKTLPKFNILDARELRRITQNYFRGEILPAADSPTNK